MAGSGQAGGGILGSVRRLADTFIGAIRNRVALFALELQQEKQWLTATLLWTAALIFFAGLAITFLTVAIVLLTPEPKRPIVLILFGALFVIMAIWAGLRLRAQFKDRAPFADTLGELDKDLDLVRSRR